MMFDPLHEWGLTPKNPEMENVLFIFTDLYHARVSKEAIWRKKVADILFHRFPCEDSPDRCLSKKEIYIQRNSSIQKYVGAVFLLANFLWRILMK